MRAPIVTLVTNSGYLPGAVALVRSLRLTGTSADIVVLHTGGVPAGALGPLAALGARLADCGLLPTSEGFNAAHARSEIHGRNPFTKGEKPAFHTPLDNFAKLRLWQLPLRAGGVRRRRRAGAAGRSTGCSTIPSSRRRRTSTRVSATSGG